MKLERRKHHRVLAPRRCWKCTNLEVGEHGELLRMFSSREWTAEDVRHAKLAGTYFLSNQCHDFADKEAERAAFMELALTCETESAEA